MCYILLIHVNDQGPHNSGALPPTDREGSKFIRSGLQPDDLESFFILNSARLKHVYF